MTDRRYFVQLLEDNYGRMLALANDGTIWAFDSVFAKWEPAFYYRQQPVDVPQPGEDPWL